MTRDGVPPAGGDGSRRCSLCGIHGHNARTCTARNPVTLFGVRIGDKPPIRNCVSMVNLAQLAESSRGARAEGYGSEGDDHKPHRKRGESWTEEEHKNFLLGLQILGRGDWRGISRNYVGTRTPTQVASHAQKYFIRQTNSNRRKRRSSLFDMVIPDSGDLPLSRSLSQEIPLSRSSSQEIALSRSSSQEVEEYVDDLQPVTAPVAPPAPVPALTSASEPLPLAVMAPPAPVPVPTYASAPAPVPIMAHHPDGSQWVCSSSNTGEAGMVMPQVIPPYGYPMIFPPPQYAQAYYPVPYYGYAPMFYQPPGMMQAWSPHTAQASHEPVRPIAVHSSPPINVEDLYSMSELNLKGDSSTNGLVSPLPPNSTGRPERPSAFHGAGPANGSSNGLIQAK
uniref:Uncharacterized protein n=1 Tax=Avena sativa TaxID=4498 RepID=A0ACD6AIV2_AVESA